MASRLNQIWRSLASCAPKRYAPISGCDSRHACPSNWPRVCASQRARVRSSQLLKARLYSCQSLSNDDSGSNGITYTGCGSITASLPGLPHFVECAGFYWWFSFFTNITQVDEPLLYCIDDKHGLSCLCDMNDYSIKTTQQLGSVLQGYRKDRKLTQRAVGEKVGFAQNVVSMMESDPGQVSLSRLFKLLSALDLELVVRRKTTVSKSEW